MSGRRSGSTASGTRRRFALRNRMPSRRGRHGLPRAARRAGLRTADRIRRSASPLAANRIRGPALSLARCAHRDCRAFAASTAARRRTVVRHLSRAAAAPARFAAALAAAAVLATTTGLAAPPAEPATLTIVHVNDLDRLDGSGDRGGVARLATVVGAVRAESAGRVLVTHGGDAISPSLLSSFDKGAHMIDLLNRIGIDAMVLGNHEFDFTPAVTVERIAEAAFPVLSSNAVEPDGGPIDGVAGRLLLEVGRYKVGMFGLTTATTATKSSPAPVAFRPVVEVAAEQARMLREAGADLVVALAHTDRAEDAALMRQGAVDLLLSGDDHDMKIEVGRKTTFVESGAQAEFVTVVEVAMDTVEGRDGPRFVWEPSFRVVNTASVAPDPEIEAVVEEYLARLTEELDVEIGATAVELDSRRRVVRSREAGIANLIADAMRAATGADAALINGGGIRGGKVHPPGTVLTRRDLRSELPFGDKTVVLEVSGADLRAALEHGVSEVAKGAGRFAQVSGMAYRFDASKPAGRRIAGVTVGGAPLDPARTYRLATFGFLGRGGDGYAMFAGAPRIVDANAGALTVAQVIEAIAAAGEIAPRVEGRIVRLD